MEQVRCKQCKSFFSDDEVLSTDGLCGFCDREKTRHIDLIKAIEARNNAHNKLDYQKGYSQGFIEGQQEANRVLQRFYELNAKIILYDGEKIIKKP